MRILGDLQFKCSFLSSTFSSNSDKETNPTWMPEPSSLLFHHNKKHGPNVYLLLCFDTLLIIQLYFSHSHLSAKWYTVHCRATGWTMSFMTVIWNLRLLVTASSSTVGLAQCHRQGHSTDSLCRLLYTWKWGPAQSESVYSTSEKPHMLMEIMCVYTR